MPSTALQPSSGEPATSATTSAGQAARPGLRRTGARDGAAVGSSGVSDEGSRGSSEEKAGRVVMVLAGALSTPHATSPYTANTARTRADFVATAGAAEKRSG